MPTCVTTDDELKTVQGSSFCYTVVLVLWQM